VSTLKHQVVCSGPALAEFNNRIVAVYKAALGRGPTSVRTRFVSDGLLVCHLEDALTRVETFLAEHDAEPEILRLRQAVRAALEPELTRHVEEMTWRKVRMSRSKLDVRAATVTEFFYLGDGPTNRILLLEGRLPRPRPRRITPSGSALR
jgi:uncharacterized protein YbcI